MPLQSSEYISEYARVRQGFKYVTIWLNMCEYNMNMSEYIWIYNNRQESEYVSYIYGKQVYYILKDPHLAEILLLSSFTTDYLTVECVSFLLRLYDFKISVNCSLEYSYKKILVELECPLGEPTPQFGFHPYIPIHPQKPATGMWLKKYVRRKSIKR